MTEKIIDSKYANLEASLKIDCEKCSGLCCVALYCMKTDGFPHNKEAGVPCKHLMSNFLCDIHSKLVSKNMRGCLAYDCFGAGQKVTQTCYPNIKWNSAEDKASEIFQVFLTIFQLHQMAWYLLESLSLVSDKDLKSDIGTLIFENEEMTSGSSSEILHLDIEEYKLKVNKILKQVSGIISVNCLVGINSKDCIGRNFKHANLNRCDFSMALLIAANLEGCSLQGTNFLGADMRDANIQNADLSASVFLTQMQINSAKGNFNTKLPDKLSRPVSWHSSQKG